jgi:hypothetical protein
MPVLPLVHCLPLSSCAEAKEPSLCLLQTFAVSSPKPGERERAEKCVGQQVLWHRGTNFPPPKVPRQCPFCLSVQVRLTRKDKTERGLCHGQRSNLSWGRRREDEKHHKSLFRFGNFPFVVLNRLNNIHTNSVRTAQETHYVSATEPNRSMLFGKTNALCRQNPELLLSK